MKVPGRIDRRERQAGYRRRNVESAINYRLDDPFWRLAIFERQPFKYQESSKVRRTYNRFPYREYNQGKIIIMKRTMIKSIKQSYRR